MAKKNNIDAFAILCPLKRNDVDCKQSNAVLALLVMMLRHSVAMI